MRRDSLSDGARLDLAAPGGRPAPVRLKVNPRARRVSLRIDPVAREAIAVAPSARALPRAAAFAAEKAGWIAAELARLPGASPLCAGAVVPFCGEPIELAFEEGRARPRLEGSRLIVPAPEPEALAGRVLRFFKAQARAALLERVAAHAATLEVAVASIAIKETRSRWGSCTSRGALAFSWRLILAPPAVLDYVAAHEVAHLREMNHSPRFWAHVARCTPDYVRLRAWLKRHGAALHGVGAPP